MTRLDANGPLVVVGAGPAGTSMALFLVKQGYEVKIYESRPDIRKVDITGGRSINLALATRGIAVLEDLGLAERVAEITIPMRGRMVHVEGAHNLQLYGSHPSDVIHSVSRGDLNSILLDAVEATGHVSIEFNSRCRSVDFGSHLLQIEDEAGSRHDVAFGMVFGTDGSASAVRDAMAATGHTEVTSEELGHGYKELTVPPADGGGFRLDPNALHIWPAGELMVIALGNPSGDFTATLFMPNTGSSDSFSAVVDGPRAKSFFREHFGDFVDLVPDLAAQFTANPVGHLATIRTVGWSYKDAGVLVGDAAHAIVPFHGQGMNAAMESCRVLDRHLRGTTDVEVALANFETERKFDTDAIADMAINNYIEMRSSVIDPRYLLQRKLALELERRWPQRVSPRYSMVMFTTMGYAEARRRAVELSAIMGQLTDGIDHISEVDFDKAAKLVAAIDPLPNSEEDAQ